MVLEKSVARLVKLHPAILVLADQLASLNIVVALKVASKVEQLAVDQYKPHIPTTTQAPALLKMPHIPFQPVAVAIIDTLVAVLFVAVLILIRQVSTVALFQQ